MDIVVAFRQGTGFGARRACIGALLLLLPAVAGATEIWLPTSLTNAPTARYEHTALWTGSTMIVWGGIGRDVTGGVPFSSGGIYNPATDTWTGTSTTNAPTARWFHTAVWTGSKMIVWGGRAAGGPFSTGGIYDPATDTWTATSTTNAPEARFSHTAVWTGSKMIVWGGIGTGGFTLPSGRIYDPATDTWTATSTTNAPTARVLHTAVWTGSRMIVWGGQDTGVPFSSGGIYDPATDTWTATSTTNAPAVRYFHTAVWTGSTMIVWGGFSSGGLILSSGGIYDPATDTWTATSTTNAPAARYKHTAVWTGSRMIAWGGIDNLGTSLSGGALYDPSNDAWTALSTTNAPTRRNSHTAVWTGSTMIVWGGNDSDPSTEAPTNTGGTYEDVPSVPSAFYTLSPCRVADTRNAAGPSGGPALAANTTRSFPVTGGACGIPSTAVAVSVNLTAVGAAAAGYLTLFPGDRASAPLASNINFTPGVTRANNAVVPLATDGTGTIKVKNGSVGDVHFVLDVSGYFQ
jgi:N-acetylneuraminic acid mutarotase